MASGARAHDVRETFPAHLDWVDRRVHGAPVTYLGQGILDPNGIIHVVFDRPDDKVNLLTPDVLLDLGELLDSVRGREDVRGLIFKSAKAGSFIAGMDIDVIASFTDAFKAAEGARFGQIIFQKIADLPIPSACALGTLNTIRDEQLPASSVTCRFLMSL